MQILIDSNKIKKTKNPSLDSNYSFKIKKCINWWNQQNLNS